MTKENDMKSQELKSAIAEDIRIIKHLDPDIIPARYYYLNLIRLGLSGFWKIWLIISMTIAYAGLYHPSTDGLARQVASQVIRESALMAFFISLGAILLLTPAINFFILFQFHLENKMKTGRLVTKKLRHIAYLFFVLFILLSMLFGSYGESAAIFMLSGFAFFGSLLATFFFVRMELTRIGISIVFTAINEFFQKGKPFHTLLK
jgi:hypothetical protein